LTVACLLRATGAVICRFKILFLSLLLLII
jgi:hypothetical protein